MPATLVRESRKVNARTLSDQKRLEALPRYRHAGSLGDAMPYGNAAENGAGRD
jgi:hypothetical protein